MHASSPAWQAAPGPYAYQLRFLEEELARAEAAHARLPAAAKKADAVTDDPGTNTARGLFLCLVKVGQWTNVTPRVDQQEAYAGKLVGKPGSSKLSHPLSTTILSGKSQNFV